MKLVYVSVLVMLVGCSGFKFKVGDCVNIKEYGTGKVVDYCDDQIIERSLDQERQYRYEVQTFEDRRIHKWPMDYVDQFDKVKCD
jgi:hypothetical protein